MTIRPLLHHLLRNPSPVSSSDAGEPDTRPEEERFPGFGGETTAELADVLVEEEVGWAGRSKLPVVYWYPEARELAGEASADHDDEDPSLSADADGATAGEGEPEVGDASSPGQADTGEGPDRDRLVVTSALRSAADNEMKRAAANTRMTGRHLVIDTGADPSPEVLTGAGADPSPEVLTDAGGAPSLPGGADAGTDPSPESQAPTLDPVKEGEAWGFHVNLGRGESLTSTDPGVVFDAARRATPGRARLSVRLDLPGQDPSVVHFPVLDVVDGELRVVKVRRETWRPRAATMAAEIDRLLAEYLADTSKG